MSSSALPLRRRVASREAMPPSIKLHLPAAMLVTAVPSTALTANESDQAAHGSWRTVRSESRPTPAQFSCAAQPDADVIEATHLRLQNQVLYSCDNVSALRRLQDHLELHSILHIAL